MAVGQDPSGRDWVAWHEPYADPTSPLSQRLSAVQRLLGDAIAAAPPGRVQVVSLCAGQGRDVLGVVPGHPRRRDVRARLVELDPANAERAKTSAAAGGLEGVEVVCGDAASTATLLGAVPAQVVLLCGIFGNISDDDVAATVAAAPSLCAPGATVIWTRHRLEPDLTPTIRAWFGDAGFDELAWVAPEGMWFGVGAHRLVGDPHPFDPGRTLFRFVGDGAGGHR